jgi:hypothetical protein
MIKVHRMDTPLHSPAAEPLVATVAPPAGPAADWNAEMLERTETLCRSGTSPCRRA